MTRWSDTPVLSGLSYTWRTGRNHVTYMFGGIIFLPMDMHYPCPSCQVPFGNAEMVFCLDPWGDRQKPQTPVICGDCHDVMLSPGLRRI